MYANLEEKRRKIVKKGRPSKYFFNYSNIQYNR